MFGLKNKTVFIYGLGKTGEATARALAADNTDLLLWDDKHPELATDLAAELNAKATPPTAVDWSQVATMIKSPGIAMTEPAVVAAVTAGTPVMGDIDLLFRRSPNAQYIGITGTNGKSTTTALIAHILRQSGVKVAEGGNLGTPALSLPQLNENGVYVLELSSYQLETMEEMQLNVAVLLNLSPDHLARHGTMQNYLNTKLRIFASKPKNAIIAIDDEHTLRAAAQINPTTVSTTGTAAIWVNENGDLYNGETLIGNLNHNISLQGKHNWQNAACAFAATAALVTPQQFIAALATFKGLPHRAQFVAKHGNCTFINDSKATNAEAAIPALKTFKNIYWICGGQAKTEGIMPCLTHLKNVKAAFTIGEAGEQFANQLSRNLPATNCQTLDQALSAAITAAANNEATILLSPACASWDQFKSFEHRGEQFAKLVAEVIHG